MNRRDLPCHLYDDDMHQSTACIEIVPFSVGYRRFLWAQPVDAFTVGSVVVVSVYT